MVGDEVRKRKGREEGWKKEVMMMMMQLKM
jgi:hypothetical protein